MDIYEPILYLGFKIIVKIVFRDVCLNMKGDILTLVEDGREKSWLLASHTMNEEAMK